MEKIKKTNKPKRRLLIWYQKSRLFAFLSSSLSLPLCLSPLPLPWRLLLHSPSVRSLQTGASGDDDRQLPPPLSPSSIAGYHVSSGGYMRGAVYREPNQPLTIEEFHIPRPKVNEILIKTKACGVCHSDLHVMKGEIPFSSPCVIGHEITGEVVEHGPFTDHKIIQRFLKIF
uniref:Alcohol dehydrogenase-like N-terminal domain-containing protein n=1 Tax=Brassica oleracea var. oleracea TaxID=109376 RepID=A0A0D3ALU2_BRAOL